jgi:hypothetical protein
VAGALELVGGVLILVAAAEKAPLAQRLLGLQRGKRRKEAAAEEEVKRRGPRVLFFGGARARLAGHQRRRGGAAHLVDQLVALRLHRHLGGLPFRGAREEGLEEKKDKTQEFRTPFSFFRALPMLVR